MSMSGKVFFWMALLGLGGVINYWLFLSGEPRAVWLVCDILRWC